MSRKRRLLIVLALLSSLSATCKAPLETPSEAAAALPELATESRPVSFERDVKPVLEARCVVCHACYDAPCQLQLGSQPGIARGATQLPVYDTSRLENAPPTRLGIDAHGSEAWRARGFHPVLEGSAPAVMSALMEFHRELAAPPPMAWISGTSMPSLSSSSTFSRSI